MSSADLDRDHAILDEAARLLAGGAWADAIELVSARIRHDPDPALEAQLIHLRHRAFAALDPIGPDDDWPPPVDDRFPGEESIPEVEASDLDAEVLASAVFHHGSLLVRGLVDPARAPGLRQQIEAAMEERESAGPTPRSFVPFTPDDYDFGPFDRAYARRGKGIHAVDAPSAFFSVVEMLKDAGVAELLTDFFGEPPVLSAKKSTLRRTPPGVEAGWHQDGSFLGDGTRSLNIWTALTPCGVDAPGLEIFPVRFDDLVETGGPGIHDWSVSEDTAARHGAERTARPEFDVGDALLFDQLTLHRTSVDPAMTQTRFATETWFFAPSTYPLDQVPICF